MSVSGSDDEPIPLEYSEHQDSVGQEWPPEDENPSEICGIETPAIASSCHEVREDGGCLIIGVEASGPGFEVTEAMGDCTDPSLKSGRGIALARKVCSEISFNERGNAVEAKYEWTRS